MLSHFIAEFIGTALLILLGDGVVANVVLKDTKGNNAGWIVITFGWAMAVFVGVFAVGGYSGAHINPAVTIGLASAGLFPWASVPTYIIGQMLGAAFGAFLVWVHYNQHFNRTEDPNLQLAVFSTGPAIRSTFNNFMSEVIGTFTLVFGVFYLAAPAAGNEIGSLSALPVGLLVLAIGLSLGGTTGYAINPARDLGPRIIHALVPIKGKRDSDWGYAWIPVIAPVVGAILAALAHLALKSPSIAIG
ncbi:Glycerol uptake facilitator protein [Poriferisphaera corsica]|uniref:Glycerol uptake facilitator protein n=1 Tax=Poriferisphaera corsica TaxID=2528020 RepID=A0A517YT56_9BACT|nr:MIP/aquaporin family protein [Poriferisphaera corsica]QDU33394.1 Glycerol uptake facilitator protein [Poriferisphaera corsica]